MEDNLSPESLKYNLQTTEKDDCFFLCKGSDDKIGAKKQYIEAYSEPLRRMLGESPLAGQNSTVKLLDTTPETFRNLLKCLYGGWETALISMSIEELVNLINCSEMYLVTTLKPKIMSVIMDQLSINNIFAVLSSQVCLQETSIQFKLSTYVCLNIEAIVDNQNFLNVTSPTMLWLLQQPSLNISEIKLWENFVKWADSKMEVRKYADLEKRGLLQHLGLVRFRVFSCVEFCQKVAPTNLLTAEDVKSVCVSLGAGTMINSARLCSSSEPRNRLLGCKTFYYTVNGVNALKENDIQYSNIFKLCDISWEIIVFKSDYSFSLFLSLGRKSREDVECTADFKLIIVNRFGKVDYVRVPPSHVFNKNEPDWGFRHFCEWKHVVSPSNGFIKDDTLTVKVELVVKSKT